MKQLLLYLSLTVCVGVTTYFATLDQKTKVKSTKVQPETLEKNIKVDKKIVENGTKIGNKKGIEKKEIAKKVIPEYKNKYDEYLIGEDADKLFSRNMASDEIVLDESLESLETGEL